MGGFTLWHWLIVLAVVVVLFGGKGKISGIMGDVAHGIRNFKEGLKDPERQRQSWTSTRPSRPKSPKR